MSDSSGYLDQKADRELQANGSLIRREPGQCPLERGGETLRDAPALHREHALPALGRLCMHSPYQAPEPPLLGTKQRRYERFNNPLHRHRRAGRSSVSGLDQLEASSIDGPQPAGQNLLKQDFLGSKIVVHAGQIDSGRGRDRSQRSPHR